MERVDQRSGDNLYPTQLEVQFGDLALSLDVPAGIWNPTPHGVHLGNVLATLDFSGESVLELGTGCGLHAIVLARRGADRLLLTEIDQDTLDNAQHNLEKHNVTGAVEYVVADWIQVETDPVDTLVTNPPFAKSGKKNRRYFIDTLILEAHKLARPGGRIIFVQSTMADVPRTIRSFEENGMSVRILGEADGPFRDYYFQDDAFLKEIASIPGAYQMRDGIHYERLVVLEGTLPG